jgi:hypothetical protein
MILYEVTGYPKSCPSETFSEGIYKTREKAELAIEQAYKDYSSCEFEIEEKYLRDK